MKTLEHISLVFFIFSTSVFSSSSMCRVQMHCGKVECSLVHRRFIFREPLKLNGTNISNSMGLWNNNNNNNYQQLHHTSHWKVQFPFFHSDLYMPLFTPIFIHVFLQWKNPIRIVYLIRIFFALTSYFPFLFWERERKKSSKKIYC